MTGGGAVVGTAVEVVAVVTVVAAAAASGAGAGRPTTATRPKVEAVATPAARILDAAAG
jgi:hypothetical protein